MSDLPDSPGLPRALTAPENPPGLSALAYRIGGRKDFHDAMVAGLAKRVPELRDLALRELSDPAAALLDAWAVVLDVLSFYQERLANEGFLRTAVDPRSLFELARTVGYRPRPGVAAGVHLSFTLEENAADVVPIPAGTRAQSLPRPGETPQPFETGADLLARHDWNLLRPNLWRRQLLDLDSAGEQTFAVDGIVATVKRGDTLLLTATPAAGGKGSAALFHVLEVEPNREQKRTVLKVARWQVVEPPPAVETPDSTEGQGAATVTAPGTPQPRTASDGDAGGPSPEDRQRAPTTALGETADWLAHALTGSPPSSTTAKAIRTDAPGTVQGEAARRLQASLDARLGRLSAALDQVTFAAPARAASPTGAAVRVYAMRVRAALFGHNVPRLLTFGLIRPLPASQWEEWTLDDDERPTGLVLESPFEGILPGSLVVIARPTARAPRDFFAPEPPAPVAPDPQHYELFTVVATAVKVRSAYGLSAKASLLTLDRPWWKAGRASPTGNRLLRQQREDFEQVIREAVVFAQSEELTPAYMPLDTAIGPSDAPTAASADAPGDTARTIELDRLYMSLPAGRVLIVEGTSALTRVVEHEVVTLAGAGQRSGHDGRLHTVLDLTEPLKHRYVRDSVRIYANVVEATHGETREELLGSGAGAAALQRFALARSPLTYVADAEHPSGARSTLELAVDDVTWRETARLVASHPGERVYALQADDEQRTGVIFGDGEHGTRLPSGYENLRALYRVGLGAAGNVGPGQISLLVSRPFGVKAVTNPRAATGGAERESAERIRRNAPLAVTALDRLVSPLDYEDFARAFAGIGKARAAELPRLGGSMILLTVAGADDAPLNDANDPLLLRLREALRRFGDPHLPIAVEPYERRILLLRARVRIAPERSWEVVERAMRARLSEQFGFERRELGQDLAPSEIYATLQPIPGVRVVDLDILRDVSARQALASAQLERSLLKLREPAGGERPTQRLRAGDGRGFDGDRRPAALILVAPEVPESIVLEQMP